MPIPFKSYNDADDYVRDLGGIWLTFWGDSRQGGYTETARLPDGTHATISNGPRDARAPFTWTVTIAGIDQPQTLERE